MEALLVSTSVVAATEMGDKRPLLSFVLVARLTRKAPTILSIIVAPVANHFPAGSVDARLAGMVARTTLTWIIALSFMALGVLTLRAGIGSA